MENYLITYDLHKPGQAYDELWKYLASIGAVRALLSVWFVRTDQPPTAVRDAMRARVDANDSIFVTAMGRPNAWNNLLDGAPEWLQRNN